MNLKEILTVSGKKGLYKLVSQGKNNIIVESLDDKSRIPVFVSTQASSLNDICIFTNDEDMPLENVFKKIFQVTAGDKIQNNKIGNDIELKKYMDEILPEYDKTRVHTSDMKKLFAWYNILQENNLLLFDNAESKESDKSDT